VISACDQVTFAALGTTAVLLVSDASALADARLACQRAVAEVDLACSRFRDDSDLSSVNECAGAWVPVSAALIEALDVAIAAAYATDGLVDPTLGRAMCDIGYDRDFSEVVRLGAPVRVLVRHVPAWNRIEIDRANDRVRIPRGTALDLGATAKAWCADRAARIAAAVTGAGVALGLGGDIAFAGPPPGGGWRVRIAEDHRTTFDDIDGPTFTMFGGGLATSGTSVRRWFAGSEPMHHIIDPATGAPAPEHWRMVSVAAASCSDANIASTAAIVLGAAATDWLEARHLPARLVAASGRVTYLAGWPNS
jgi:thiamine biosynthesis lipoprotein